MISIIFLVLLNITSLTCLFFSVRKNLVLVEKLEEIDDSIQQTIDILEEQYQIIDQKTKIEVFSDEPVVRNLVKDIVNAKNAVLKSAKILDDMTGESRENETIVT